jgi:hypothetical protein
LGQPFGAGLTYTSYVIATLLGFLVLGCRPRTDAIARGVIQYGEKESAPNKLEFAVYFLSDHITIDVPGAWRFESYRDHQTVSDVRASRAVEVLRDPNLDEGSSLYPYVKRIFPILPFDYVLDQDTEKAKKEIAELKADAKANFEETQPDDTNTTGLPKEANMIEFRYKDPLSNYANQVTWWLAEQDASLPRTIMFMLEQPDGKMWAYNYTGFAEDLQSAPSLEKLSIKESLQIKADEIAEGGKTKDGKLAIEWLKATAMVPEFTLSH